MGFNEKPAIVISIVNTKVDVKEGKNKWNL